MFSWTSVSEVLCFSSLLQKVFILEHVAVFFAAIGEIFATLVGTTLEVLVTVLATITSLLKSEVGSVKPIQLLHYPSLLS